MSSGHPRLLVIVPAWNEQETLPAVLAELRESVPTADVLVVSDGSTDATAQSARAAGARVLELPINLGVGGAMRAGYRYALRNDYDLTVQLDADGQHNPADIPLLLGTIAAEQADVVIGARFAGVGSYSARGPRRWSMRVLAAALSRVTRTRLTDSTSGFKACDRRAIRLFSANYPAEYLGDTVESLVIAARAGLTVRQVGVAMRPRAGGTPSHSPLKAGVFLVRAVFAFLIALSRPTEPLPGHPADEAVG
jgi:glycosyltransferase involved in cell wall biosynthesis